LHDPQVAENAIQDFMEHSGNCDYLRIENYPRGLDTEVFSFAALKEAFSKATAKPDREHVTPYLYHNPGKFKITCRTYPKDYSAYRWTVDTKEDFELIRRLLEELYPVQPEFSWQDVLTVIRRHPDWQLLNAQVQQKKYGE
jgi:spore coat polysaccharide biosynthesis protein SpsF